MRDSRLNGGEFLFVRSIDGDAKISALLRDELFGASGVTATEHAGVLTIVCPGLVGLGSLADIATDIDDECPDIRFRVALSRELVKRIG